MNDLVSTTWADNAPRYAPRRRPRSGRTIIHKYDFDPAPPEGFTNLRDTVQNRLARELEDEVREGRRQFAKDRIELNRGMERLADLRMLRGFSQDEAAKLIGTSQARLSRWESGKDYPSYENIVELARVLAVDFNRLLGSLANG